jgi:hypothetical protein
MKIIFLMDDQVHHFKISGEMNSEDLQLLKQSLVRFLESTPEFVILDLSEIILHVPEIDLQAVLTEIRTLASAKGMHLQVAMSDFEVGIAKNSVLRNSLERKIKLLEGKIELREEMKRNLDEIRNLNRALKSELEDKTASLSLSRRNPFNPLFERLWSEK